LGDMDRHLGGDMDRGPYRSGNWIFHFIYLFGEKLYYFSSISN